MRIAVALASLLVSLACDASPDASAEKPTKAASDEPASKSAPPEKATEPKPLPPAPEGTVEIDGRYVHTCAESSPCPSLMHAAGAAHCEGLTLGGLSWRLPTADELQSWKGRADLVGFDVFHWSGTPWQEDPGQIWIYDPGSEAKTTAKPDRKAFTIRCVAEPNT